MIIDLRTEPEKIEVPRDSDVEIEVSKPPWSAAERKWLAKTLVSIARGAPRGEVFHLFCAKGKRTALAAQILRAHGYKVEDWGGVG